MDSKRHSAFDGFVDLSQARLVAQGRVRFVYEHDDFPGMLIKVVKPAALRQAADVGSWRTHMKLKRRYGIYNQIRREISEYLACVARQDLLATDWPIARQFGFVETNQGVGFLNERLSAPNGELAPSLGKLARGGRFNDHHRETLENFINTLINKHVCVYDLTPNNIVYVGDGRSKGRFVAIDGLGSNTAIPMRDWFAWYNAMQTKGRAKSRLWPAIERGARPAAANPNTTEAAVK